MFNLKAIFSPFSGLIDEQQRRIENSPQFKNGEFAGIIRSLNLSFLDHIIIVLRYLFTKNNQTPKEKLPVKQVEPTSLTTTAKSHLTSTWLGHSSLLLNINGYKILTDPVLNNKMSIIGPGRINGDLPMVIEQLPQIDAVIISHDHHDHLNKFSIKYLNNITNKFITPLAVGSELVAWGVPRDKIIELDWWETYTLDQEIKITATPSQHFSGRSFSTRNRSLWASWVIQSPEYKMFFSGDSGYFNKFKTIGNKLGPFDMTFLECGAYDKLWHSVHMFPEQTVKAHLDLKGNILHPIHWSTFNLSFHPWFEPIQRITKAAESAQVRLTTPVVGDTIVYNKYTPSLPWWEHAIEKQAS